MKKIIFIALSALLCSTTLAQTESLKEYLRFTPSNLNQNNINPSDIPSEQVLRQMGLSRKSYNLWAGSIEESKSSK